MAMKISSSFNPGSEVGPPLGWSGMTERQLYALFFIGGEVRARGST